MSSDRKPKVAVVGAGTMGAGIAQLAILNGHQTILIDTIEASLYRGIELIRKNLNREVEKNRKSSTEVASALALLAPSQEIKNCATADFVIEAIIESQHAKEDLLTQLEQHVATETVLATNTSSLSIAGLAGPRAHPERVIGVHFFNPAPLMKLVEIVPGLLTDPKVTDRATALVKSWGKTVVHTKDTPGFIVNRVARPFYGEALRIAEEGANYSTIDASMKALGFKMGPFELMDLIGNDINYAVTCSIFESFFYDPRYRPSILQKRMLENHLYGRKTKRGYYEYKDGEQAVASHGSVDSSISSRILAMLINEAAEAARLSIASKEEIDLAMTLGVNYPKGLLRWCDEIGAAEVVKTLDQLRSRYQEERYRASPILRDYASENKRFFN